MFHRISRDADEVSTTPDDTGSLYEFELPPDEDTPEELPAEVYANDLDDPLVAPTQPDEDDPFQTDAQRLARLVSVAKAAAGAHLNLADKALTEIPDALIDALVDVESLDLSSNRLRRLPARLSELKSLTSLNVANNEISEIPVELGALALAYLDVSANELREFPEAICVMRRLKRLNIDENYLQRGPDVMRSHSTLIEVTMSNNQLVDVPYFIYACPKLESLGLSDNRIRQVDWTLARLEKLRALHMSSNLIESWNVDLSATVLEDLQLQNNRLTTFDGPLPLTCKELDLSGNALSVAPKFSTVEQLDRLDLRENELRQLPVDYAGWRVTSLLFLDDNPWDEPLPTIIDRGIRHIIQYLSSLDDSIGVFEAKIMLVGEGEVGKSSLLAALRGDPFVEGRATTHGIELNSFGIQHPDFQGLPIKLNSWDFGGQEVYRITHQFFFSRRAIYLLVWKPRIGQEESAIEDWCERIWLRVGPEANVIIVATHGDERRAELDLERIRRRFPGLIHDSITVDSRSGSNLDALLSVIASLAVDLPQMGERINQRWVEARSLIEACSEPFISRVKFERICAEVGLDESSTEVFAHLLHDLGQIIYYSDDDGLRDIVVLQPEWITKAIGLILEDQATRDAAGVLNHQRLSDIWDDKSSSHGYDRAHFPYFLRLMEKFDVSYRLPDGTSSLVAQLVPYERPAIPNERNPGDRFLRVTFRASSRTVGLISWLTVRNHRYSTGLHWRKGVYLELLQHSAHGLFELTDDGLGMTILVRAPAPQYFFDILRSSLEALIQDRWPTLQYSLLVPCRTRGIGGAPCSGMFRLEALEKFRARGEPRIVCQACAEWADVAQLLTGFGTSDATLNEVVARLDGLTRVATRIEVRTSEVARFSRAALSILESEVTDCPRLFTLEAKNRSRIRSMVSLNDVDLLRLWCEQPGHEHAVSGDAYELVRVKERIAPLLPYVKVVLQVLKSVIPVASAVTGLLPDAEQAESLGKDLDLMSALTDGLSDIADTANMADLDETTNRISKAEGAGLRAFRQLLFEIDPSRTFANLRRVRTSSNDLLWVCPVHYREYDPGLPSL